MSLFLPNIPLAPDQLDFSQGQLLSNNMGLDTVFGVDHYKFSDATVNKGFHNQVTTPPYIANPSTGLPPVTVASPIFYAFQQTAPLGVLQYSRGPSNAVPTPLTNLQSSSTPIVLGAGATTNVLDFTGIPLGIGMLYAFDSVAAGNVMLIAAVFWTGSAFKIRNIFGTTLSTNVSGNILQIKNTSVSALTSVFWSFNLKSLQ